MVLGLSNDFTALDDDGLMKTRAMLLVLESFPIQGKGLKKIVLKGMGRLRPRLCLNGLSRRHCLFLTDALVFAYR